MAELANIQENRLYFRKTKKMHVKHKKASVSVVFILICLVPLSHIVYLTLASRRRYAVYNAVHATALKLGIIRGDH